MTAHAEYALGGARITQVLNLLLAVPTPKTSAAKSLIAREDGEVLDLVAARIAAVRAIVAYQRAVAEEEEVRVGVEEGAAGVASEAVNVPSIAS